MPILQIFTNVPKSKIPADFVAKTTEVWQGIIDKPMQFIVVRVVPDQMMSFVGTQEPCALVTVDSVGKIGKDENKKYSEQLTKVLSSIGVKKDRMFVLFEDLPAANVGYDGTTLAFWAPKKTRENNCCEIL